MTRVGINKQDCHNVAWIAVHVTAFAIPSVNNVNLFRRDLELLLLVCVVLTSLKARALPDRSQFL